MVHPFAMTQYEQCPKAGVPGRKKNVMIEGLTALDGNRT
jgi:hypothetical protein